jgi:O-succinylbenzoate synthase
LDLLRRVDEFQLAMIEQPLAHDDLVGHAQLQSQMTTPICLDESVTSLSVARQAIELGSCRFINVKPGRVGGLASAVAIHNACRDAGIGCWVGGMLESATGAAQCAALAMLDHFTYPADIFPSSRFYAEDLSNPPLELHRSAVGVPCVRALDKLPEPVPARLAKWIVAQCAVR